MKDQLYTTVGFIFNNYSSFVNLLLPLILCGDGVYAYKIKKKWSLVMQLLISYQLNGYQENFNNQRNKK